MKFLTPTARFPTLVWIILLGTFATRATFFMIWPFLAIILHNRFGLAEAVIGGMLGFGALAGTVAGFFVGNLSDRIGRRGVMISGALLSALAFAVMAEADQPLLYLAAATITGIARALLEPPSKALISDRIPDRQSRELAFQLRYFLLNLGAAGGPLLGLAVGLTAQQSTFHLLAGGYLVYTLALVLAFRAQPESRPKRQGEAGLRQALRVLGADRAFLLLILANICMMYAYAQHETSLVQYLAQGDSAAAVTLFTWLITTNALTVVLFQFPLLKLMELWPLAQRMKAGVVLLGLSYVVFALLARDNTWGWIAATFVLSLGEVILFPTLNLQIDRMAPEHLKGSYFGAAGFYAFGFAAGPALGGVVLQLFGGPILFLTTAALCALVGLLYWQADRMERPANLLAEAPSLAP